MESSINSSYHSYHLVLLGLVISSVISSVLGTSTTSAGTAMVEDWMVCQSVSAPYQVRWMCKASAIPYHNSTLSNTSN
jgi:hypothetical protein